MCVQQSELSPCTLIQINIYNRRQKEVIWNACVIFLAGSFDRKKDMSMSSEPYPKKYIQRKKIEEKILMLLRFFFSFIFSVTLCSCPATTLVAICGNFFSQTLAKKECL